MASTSNQAAPLTNRVAVRRMGNDLLGAIGTPPASPLLLDRGNVVQPKYSRDSQRTKVYEAENTYMRLIRRRAEFPVLELAGSRVTLLEGLRFGALPQVQDYVNTVCRNEGASRITVRAGERLANRAHYAGGVISLPLAGRDHRWAWREEVLLHEIAHHLTAGDRHNGRFTSRLVDLFSDYIGPEAGFLLRLLLSDQGATLS